MQSVWLMSYPDWIMLNTRFVEHSQRKSQLARKRLRGLRDQVPEIVDAFYGTFTCTVLYRSSLFQVLSAEQRDQMRAWIHYLDLPAVATNFVFFHLSNRCNVAPAVKVPLEGEQRHKSTVPVVEPDVRRLAALFPGMPCPRVAIRVPPVWAALLVSGCWDSVCLPDNMIDWDLLPELAMPAPIMMPDLGELVVMHEDEKEFQNIADSLRRLTLPDDPDMLHEHMRFIMSVQGLADTLNVDSFRRDIGSSSGHRTLSRSNFLLKALLLAHGARSQTNMSQVIQDCISLCLPQRLRHMTKELVDTAVQVLPSAATLSRQRMMLDGAMMLYMRDINRRRAARGGSCRYMLADASQQCGREFEAVVSTTIRHRDVAQAAVLAQKLYDLRKRVGLDVSDAVLAEENEIMDSLRALMDDHVLPLVCLNPSRANLAQKFQKVSHTLFLESGRNPQDLARVMDEHIVLSGDMGTEFGLASV